MNIKLKFHHIKKFPMCISKWILVFLMCGSLLAIGDRIDSRLMAWINSATFKKPGLGINQNSTTSRATEAVILYTTVSQTPWFCSKVYLFDWLAMHFLCALKDCNLCRPLNIETESIHIYLNVEWPQACLKPLFNATVSYIE